MNIDRISTAVPYGMKQLFNLKVISLVKKLKLLVLQLACTELFFFIYASFTPFFNAIF